MPTWTIDQILLAFLSRQKIWVTQAEWEFTVELLRIHQLQDSNHVLRLLKETKCWKPLEHITANQWQKEREQILRCQEKGVKFCLFHELPPTTPLIHLADPPRCLCFLGSLDHLWDYQSLAVVGSREAKADLLLWLDRELNHLLQVNHRILLVSGGARGVDQQAHFTAIKAQRPTMVWLPSGVMNLYPPQLQAWIEPILEYQGCFISEYHPLESMKKWYFHQRNRLIVGMSRACFIPQARFKSGSWLSATLAAELGVTLFTLSALPWDESFSGNIKLIEEGAQCLLSSQDLIHFFSTH